MLVLQLYALWCAKFTCLMNITLCFCSLNRFLGRVNFRSSPTSVLSVVFIIFLVTRSEGLVFVKCLLLFCVCPPPLPLPMAASVMLASKNPPQTLSCLLSSHFLRYLFNRVPLLLNGTAYRIEHFSFRVIGALRNSVFL